MSSDVRLQDFQQPEYVQLCSCVLQQCLRRDKRTFYCKRSTLRGISQGRLCWITVFCDVISCVSADTASDTRRPRVKNVEMHSVKILIYHVDMIIFIYLSLYSFTSLYFALVWNKWVHE